MMRVILKQPPAIARSLEFDHLAMERELSRDRTGWTMGISVVVHALLIFLLITIQPAANAAESLTEITLVDPGQPDAGSGAPAGAAAPAPAGPSASGEIHSSSHDEHFLRRGAADISPDPQSNAMADQIDARLATMRDNKTEPAISGAATGAPSALWSAPAGVPNSVGASGTHSLSRGEGLSPTPALTLGRGASLGSGTSVAADVGTPQSAGAAPAAAPQEDASVHRSLAGAMLMGPVANRPVLHMVTPAYPDWAKHDGVEATVTLSFVVRPDGVVKENVLVQKTAGFSDFDDNARVALAQWRFQALPGGQTGEQWGTITFRYRLRDS